MQKVHSLCPTDMDLAVLRALFRALWVQYFAGREGGMKNCQGNTVRRDNLGSLVCLLNSMLVVSSDHFTLDVAGL